jgi:drug/metabolite transporter (DMT)-like permease
MTLKFSPISFVIIGIASTSLAQILLKFGSSFDVLSKKWIISLFMSLLTYSISFLSYYLALRFYDITKISPVMMASTVSIVALYGFSVGENMNFSKLIGILLAILSIFLISKS